MAVKAALKRAVLGSGPRARRIRLGLLRGSSFVVDPTCNTLRLLGLAETEIAAETRRLASTARSAVDVGASDGWYTVYFASLPHMAQVIACEPDEHALGLVEENLRLNGLEVGNRVRLVRGMVGSDDAAGRHRLDTLCEGVPDPLLLKIDTEGGELDCLRSAEKTLRARRVTLIVETHSAPLERDCVAYLEGLGYRCRVIDHGWYRLAVPELRPLPHNRWFVAERNPA